MKKIKKWFHIDVRDIVVCLMALTAIALFVPVFTYAYFAKDIQSKESIMNRNNTGVVLLDRKGRPYFSFYQGKLPNFIPLSDIPQVTREAVLSGEDKRFYSHAGFSLVSIIGAFIADSRHGSFDYGGSTITQQLVKNALLNSNKNFLRKYQEVVLAEELERRYSKDEILEMYLNSVYFGEGAFGVENASLTYFGKNAKDLDLAESAQLAALLPAPSQYSPISGDKVLAKAHQKAVLQRMIEDGYINQSQANLAAEEKLTFIDKNQDNNPATAHFALMVKEELNQKYGEEQVARSGFQVKTTLDLDYQNYAQASVLNQVAKLKPDRVSNGAAVVENPKTGEILALVGSKDWNDPQDGKFNVATALRSPGSSFKPITYSRALEERIITPATLLNDSPITYKPGPMIANAPYSPLDFDRRFRGKVTVRRALVNSLNIPAVEVLNKIGVPAAVDQAKKLGITTLKDPENYGLSLTLGTGEVKLLELTNVYATFANQGTINDPTLITEITDKHNQTVYKYEPHGEQVLEPEVAFQIASILSDNQTRAEEFGNTLNITRPAAVKTGTAEDFKDALTMGFTPSLTVGVWVGNNDGTPMDQIAGSLGAAPIWKDLMEHFLKDTPVEQFQPPLGIVDRKICKYNGLLVKDNSPESSISAKEYFIRGTEPTQFCYQTATSSAAYLINIPGQSPIPAPSPGNQTVTTITNPDGSTTTTTITNNGSSITTTTQTTSH